MSIVCLRYHQTYHRLFLCLFRILDWCVKNWQKDYKILICHFPKEYEGKSNICIPTGTDGKFRVRNCLVFAEKNLADIGLGEK